jgi:hypothetical protein
LGALSGNFKETVGGCIPISDIEADAFDVFVDWLYEKQLPACVHKPWPRDSPIVSLKTRAYVLADRLMVADLKRALLDAAFDVFPITPRFSCFPRIIYLFEYLPEGDPMLRLMVDSFCFNDGVRKINDPCIALVPQMPQTFLSGVLLKLNEISNMAAHDRKLRRKDYTIEA